MAGTGMGKAKSKGLDNADLDAAELDNVDAREDDREEGRRSSERNEAQDLNQGMDTGTHDTTRSGVNWGDSYRGPTPTGKSRKKNDAGTSPPNQKSNGGKTSGKNRGDDR